MRGAVRVSVNVAIEAGDATMRARAAAVFRIVELLLWKRSDQQTQALDLLGVQNPVEELIRIGDRYQFPLRDIAQVRPRGQIDCWREFRQHMIRKIEVEIEASKVALLLFLDFVNVELREN